MKTYCKNVDVTDVKFIFCCVYECFDGKWNRSDVQKLLFTYSKKSDNPLSRNEIRRIIADENKTELNWVIELIAKDISDSIKNRTIILPPIKYSERYDTNSKKFRTIGTQSIIHQCYEYVAVNATKELFNKKIGVYQCASIPGKGQSYGKKAIEKWVSNDIKGTRYAVKMDVRKCYPSINQIKLKKMLKRDIHKNSDLLYLLYTLIDMFDEGLSIGSHLSQWLCNYYLSYAYHYISERIFIARKSKRSNTVGHIRAISHVIFYMDDIIIFGSNKKYLMIATKLIINYFNLELDLTIKPNWFIFKVQYVDKYGKIHGTFVDMMGFRFYRGKTSIRKSIFIKMRRKYNRVRKRLNNHKYLPKKSAQSVMSYWGWIANTNSYTILNKYEVRRVTSVSRKQVSYYAKLSNS